MLQEDSSEKLQLQDIITSDLDHLKELITITSISTENGTLQEKIRSRPIETQITSNSQTISSSLKVQSGDIEVMTTFIKFSKDSTDQTTDGQGP
jgi:hypothetical protein